MDIKEQLFRQIREAKNVITTRTKCNPKIGLILGTGLGDVADFIDEDALIPYGDIPHFPTSITEGHEGNLLIGKYKNQEIVAMKGRFHLYEGYTARGIALPIQVLGSLGLEKLIITNSSGLINMDFPEEGFMLIKDQINLTGENPLLGPNEERMGPRFPNMVGAFDIELRKLAKTISKEKGITLSEGVYVGLKGPSFETPAEIHFLRTIGADAVGMSTVLEVITARHIGIRVLGVSCLTNVAAAEEHDVSHEEVIETATKKCSHLKELITGIIDRIEPE